MGTDRDDDLARTATAGDSSAGALPADPIGPTLGRYRLERELGAGGMGVVHAAFDPDLERRIALKVLRTGGHATVPAGGGEEAQRRLLREARAMARLTHPNVVTVHEVGSANGRDFVAMEMVEGETLAEWLRAERRTADEVIEAFVAAGRGLAAAHAAGIVHRDFKPHNVLRSRGGRIVVTDFGLAREATAVAPDDGAAAARPVAGAVAVGGGLGGVTMTGSVLGTPAYMAPEQWSGGTVTPATDQFAFCVALWEALAGERPFRGATIELLRAEVARGPDELDASKLPRRLRRALRRGLVPDPARRWPSMDALLAAIARAQRRPVTAFAIAVGAVVAAAVVYAAVQRAPGAERPSCPPPGLDPDAVWSSATARALAAGKRALEARAIDADHARWTAARTRACALDPVPRVAALSCLDGVLARLDLVARAVQALPRDALPVDPGELLIDPAVCETATPPRLITTSPPELREVVATLLREAAIPGPFSASAAVALVERVNREPCAAARGYLLAAESTRVAAERDRHVVQAEQEAERCGDDRVRAEVATLTARRALGGGFLGTGISAKLKLAELAIARVAQRDLAGDLDALRLEVALRADNLDEAIARGELAMAGYEARGRLAAALAIGLRVLDLRGLRARPDDRAHVQRSETEWRARAVRELGADHPIVHKLDGDVATRAFIAGDVAGAHARLAALRRPVPGDRPRRIAGVVVDERGAPVAGAMVIAGPALVGDSVGVAIAFQSIAPAMRDAVTGANGEFAIADGPDGGVVIAQLADRRSPPAPVVDGAIELVLGPTSRVEGRVDLRGEPASRVTVSIQDPRAALTVPYELFAPVQADGTFVFEGAPRGRVRVFAALRKASGRTVNSVTVEIREPVMRGVALAVATSNRVVHVIVRSTVAVPVANAQVFAFPGVRASTTAREMESLLAAANLASARQIEGEHAPAPVVAASPHPGDMFATLTGVPEGVASACAVGLPADLSDPDVDRKFLANLDKIEVRCAPIRIGADVVVVEVPPWPRLD